MISKSEIIEAITHGEDGLLSDLINAAVRRYGVLHPDWEVMFLSLPRNDPRERHRCVEETVAFLYSIAND